jgi:hypothetical protein
MTGCEWSALQVLQDVPLVNSSDSALTATATLTGKGYSGPRELTVPAKGTGAYQLSFCPPGSGTFSGTLELFIAATGERNVYTLLGKGSEPLAEGHIVVECQVWKHKLLHVCTYNSALLETIMLHNLSYTASLGWVQEFNSQAVSECPALCKTPC